MKNRLLTIVLAFLPLMSWGQGTTDPQPYARLAEDGNNNLVLTFYYNLDKNDSDFGIGPFTSASDRGWHSSRANIKEVVFDESFASYDGLSSMNMWFYQMSGLTKVTGISNLNTANVTSLRSTFNGCSSLTTLDLSTFNTANVKSNMDYMFSSCSALTTIYVSDLWTTENVTSGNEMFNACQSLVGGQGTTFSTSHRGLDYAHIDGGTANPGYFTEKVNYNDGDIFTAETVEGIMLKYRVISEADKTCQVGTMVDTDSWISSDIANAVDDPMVEGTITIPEYAKGYRVIKIGYEAFINCTQVTSIVIPNTVTEITTAAMAQSGLTAITIPSSVSSIHYDFLHNCSNLESIVVEEGNQVYDSRNSCNALIETATNKLMMGCKTSTVPNGIETIGTAAFILCKGLTAIELPNTVTRIETQAFNSSDLSSINLPPSLEYIGYSCFAGSNVTSFVIPANVKEIMLGAFNCNGLTSIVVEQGNQVYDSRDNCNAIIETATNTLFEGFSVTVIPNSVTAIGSSAFREVWSLHEITIPESVAAIGEYAFGHIQLEKVTSERPVPVEIPDNAFPDNCYEQATLYVPYGTKSLYEQTEGWNKFQNIVEMEAPAVNATFDNHGVLTVGGTATMTEALETVGGVSAVAETVTAVVWNSTATLTNSDLQDLDNPNMLVYVPSVSQAPVNRDNVIIGNDNTGYTAKNIVLTDVESGNQNFYCPKAFVAEMITYAHDYLQQTEVGVSRGWETIALPFTVQTIMHEKQGVIAPFGNDASNKHFWLRQLMMQGLTRATVIEANMPYLIAMPNSDAYAAEFNLNGRVTFSSQNVEVPQTQMNVMEAHDANDNMMMFVPCFQAQPQGQEIYALNVGEQRDNHPEGSVFEANYREVRPFEAFTVHNGNGPAPRFVLISEMMGGATEVEDVRSKMSDGRGDNWYDMNGRKLQKEPTRKGVYLNKGRKVVVQK